MFLVLSIITLIFFFPIIKNIQLSTTDAQFVEASKFIGLQNYLNVLQDYNFWHAAIITLIYTTIYTISIFIVGIITALLLDKAKGRRKTIFRTFFVLPFAIPDTAAALVFLWMLDYQFGILNYFLNFLHLTKVPVLWLSSSPLLSLITVISVEIWRFFPLHTLIIYAAMQNIPKELYEAAEIDGAGGIAKFFKITIPQLKRILSILFVLTIIWCFRRFTMIWLLTRGGPARGTETIVIQLYKYAFPFNKMSYASTIGMILLLITIVLAVVYFKYSKQE